MLIVNAINQIKKLNKQYYGSKENDTKELFVFKRLKKKSDSIKL